MKVIKEINLQQFMAWGEGKKTISNLTPEQQEKVQYYIKKMYPDGIEEGELNDFLWFNRNFIAHDILRFDDWEDLLIGDDEEQRVVRKLNDIYGIDSAIIEQFAEECCVKSVKRDIWGRCEDFEDWLMYFGADVLHTEFPDADKDAIDDYMVDCDPMNFDRAELIDGFCEYLKVLKEEEEENAE